MRTRQVTFSQTSAGADDLTALQAIEPQLLLVFASVEFFQDGEFFASLRQACPQALLVGCSSAGEIAGELVLEHSAVVTAVHFSPAISLRVEQVALKQMDQSAEAGAELGRRLKANDLQLVLLFGKGLEINGSGLIQGLELELEQGRQVPIAGGLAGDGAAFVKTYTLSPQGVASDAVVALGFYGSGLEVARGSYGGWKSFGPVRKVTRSEDNVLFELDGESALQIYRNYLGEYARDLPTSGLLFPFEMLREDHSTAGLIRTILGVDEEREALILAGDIDPDGYLRLMHSSTDDLVDGASEASRRGLGQLSAEPTDGLVILVSCVGRKLVMGDRVDEELEEVREVFGPGVSLTGFYSYGEIGPFSAQGGDCKLHNQSLTLTYINEA
ncbi:MAG: FIST C-terminal domain-containing protein [Gammaproteobacteria bacterium]|nr:FIST C-terminal domain-containing protein [Gammaproteobacteria bacterium]